MRDSVSPVKDEKGPMRDGVSPVKDEKGPKRDSESSVMSPVKNGVGLL